jgi:hypothetical protein
LSDYTFELNAVDRASPVVEAAVQRIRTVLEQGSAQLSNSLRILPRFDAGALDQMVTQLNAIGDRAVEQMRISGAEIGQALQAGLVPDQTLGVRLNGILREALVQARSQIEQFTASTNIIPGGRQAGEVLEFAESFQQSMLRSIQTVATELRAQLNAAAREVGLDPRAVTGQFQGARIATGSTQALVGSLGTEETHEQLRLRLDRLRQAESGAESRVAAAVQATEDAFEEAVNAVVQGLALTQEQMGLLRQRGVAFDLRDPTSRSLTPINGPIGVRDIGQGQPSVYQVGRGEGAQYDPVEQTVQLQRATERAVQVLEREGQAGAEAAAADEARAVAARNLARLLSDPQAVLLRGAIRSGQGEFFSREGVPITGDDPQTTLRVRELQQQYLNLLRRRNAEMERVAAQQPDNSFGGVLNRFLGGAGGVGFDAHAGFKSDEFLGNIAGTIGVLARYGAGGIAVTGAFRGFSALRTEVVDYQTALASLDEVLQATGTDQVNVNAAIDAAAPAGIGAADAVNLGADALARYRNEIEAGADASTVMVTSLNSIGQAAVLTGQDVRAAAEQLIDASQGFGLGPSGQSRILDAVENARRNFGGDRAQILQAIADSGDLAASAGVDPEQLANMVALIQARTGASGTSVASSIERTISRQGTSSFRQALSGLGIQDTGNIVTEIVQMSDAWDRLSKTQRDALVAELGGARQARELLPLLEEGKDLVNANSRSYAGAGAAADQYARQQRTLAGEIRQIGGELRDVAQGIGQSGILGFVGPLVVGVRDVIGAADEMLRIFNEIPAPIRYVAASIIELTLALRLLGSEEQQRTAGQILGRIPVLGGFARRVGLPTGATAVAPETEAGAVITSSAETFAETVVAAARQVAVELQGGGAAAAEELTAGGAAAGAEQVAGGLSGAARSAETGALVGGIAEAPLPGLEAGLGGAEALSLGAGAGVAAGAAGLLTNPITFAIGGLIAIGGISSAMHRLDSAAAQGASALETVGTARTSQQFTTAADALISARQQLAQGSSGPFGTVAGWLTGNGAREREFSQAARFAQDEARRIAAEQANAQTATSGFFGSSGVDIPLGLQNMAQAGIDANTQLQAVAQALGLVAARSTDASSQLVGVRTAQTRLPGLLANESTLLDLAAGATYGGPTPNIGDRYDGYTFGKSDQDLFNQDTRQRTAPRVRTFLQNRGLGPNDVLTDDQLQQLAGVVHPWQDFIDANGLDDHGRPINKDTNAVEAARQQAIASTLAYYRSLQDKAATAQQGALTDSSLDTLLNGTKGANAQPGLLGVIQGFRPDPFDPTGGASGLRRNVQILQSYTSRADQGGEHYPELIAALHDAEDRYAAAQIANIEKLRQVADARTNPAAQARVDQGFFDQEIAAAGADTNQLISIINNMTDAQVKLADATLLNGVQTAQAALRSAQQLAAHLPADERGMAGVSQAQQQLQAAQDNYNALQQAKNYRVGPGAAGGMTPAQQARLAQIQAGAQPGNAVQDAEVALQAAQYQLSIARPNTAAYYQAQKAVTDAEYQLAQAHVQVGEAAAQAGTYPGSQISQAAAQINVARQQLQAAVAGTAEYYNALGQLHQAQIAYGNAVLADQANVELLGGDITDPVFRARATLDAARRQLGADRRRGAPSDVLHSDELAVKQDAAAAEQAAFQQRMNDAEVAHNLGQMSDAAYMRFLEGQLAYLEKIKHRTRQQTEELQSVEQALKDANQQLSGQFNIGEIMAPTVYAARALAAGRQQGVTTTQHVEITINDYSSNHQAAQLLSDALGGSATGRLGTVPPKVGR